MAADATSGVCVHRKSVRAEADSVDRSEDCILRSLAGQTLVQSRSKTSLTSGVAVDAVSVVVSEGARRTDASSGVGVGVDRYDVVSRTCETVGAAAGAG